MGASRGPCQLASAGPGNRLRVGPRLKHRGRLTVLPRNIRRGSAAARCRRTWRTTWAYGPSGFGPLRYLVGSRFVGPQSFARPAPNGGTQSDRRTERIGGANDRSLRGGLRLTLEAADDGVPLIIAVDARARTVYRLCTSMRMRQWSLGPQASTAFWAVTVTRSAIDREANTKSSCRVAPAGPCCSVW